MAKSPRNVYLNNSLLLEALHLSKLSVATLHDAPIAATDYDCLVPAELAGGAADADAIDALGRQSRVQRQQQHHRQIAADLGIPVELEPHPERISAITVRHYIPKTDKKNGTLHFPPYEHREGHNGRLVMTVAAHVDDPRPVINDALSRAILLLVTRMSKRGNWRNYSYLEEMIGDALLQMLGNALKFNEAKTDNPFAYLTAVANNAFVRRLNVEKKQHDIRDDVLEMNGATPSHTRQAKNAELKQ